MSNNKSETFPKSLIFGGVIVLLGYFSAAIIPDAMHYCLANRQLAMYETVAIKKLVAITTLLKEKKGRIGKEDLVLQATLQFQNFPPITPPSTFDAYGRLLTLLAGLISLVVVFFGYFMRRSIKETEQEIRDELKQGVTDWDTKLKDVHKDLLEAKTKWESQSKAMANVMREKEDSEKAYKASAVPDPAGVSSTVEILKKDPELGGGGKKTGTKKKTADGGSEK